MFYAKPNGFKFQLICSTIPESELTAFLINSQITKESNLSPLHIETGSQVVTLILKTGYDFYFTNYFGSSLKRTL